MLVAALVLAHFTATTVTGTAIRTCGPVTATSATYSGPAMTIDAHSVIDAHTGMGLVTGTLKSPAVTGRFSAVYDHGVISGTTTGHVGTRPLIAGLSASFEPTDGFTHGVIGGRNTVGAAVLDSSCATPSQKQLRHAQGIVKASNAIEITVGSLTCVVPPRLAITVTFKYGAGSRVSITCSASNGKATLVSIKAKK